MRPQRRAPGLKKVCRVMRVWRGGGPSERGNPIYADDGQLARSMVAARAHYPCPYCGNPRRWWGQRSYHERQADEAFEQQLREAGFA